jgi:hypothetical protein
MNLKAASLLLERNSLFRQNNSLFGFQNSLFCRVGNFDKNPRNTRLFRVLAGPQRAEIAEIPCIFPDDQGN